MQANVLVDMWKTIRPGTRWRPSYISDPIDYAEIIEEKCLLAFITIRKVSIIAITATTPSAEDSLVAYIFCRADGKGDTALGPVGQHWTGRRGLKVTQSFFSK